DNGDSTVVKLRDEEPPAPPPTNGRPKTKPTKFLPTDRIAWNRWFDLLRAYAIESESGEGVVTNGQVAKVMQMAESTVALANPFFTGTGFLTRTGSGFIPAPEVIAYRRGFEWKPETASEM